jgi:hypothetical protein
MISAEALAAATSQLNAVFMDFCPEADGAIFNAVLTSNHSRSGVWREGGVGGGAALTRGITHDHV